MRSVKGNAKESSHVSSLVLQSSGQGMSPALAALYYSELGIVNSSRCCLGAPRLTQGSRSSLCPRLAWGYLARFLLLKLLFPVVFEANPQGWGDTGVVPVPGWFSGSQGYHDAFCNRKEGWWKACSGFYHEWTLSWRLCLAAARGSRVRGEVFWRRCGPREPLLFSFLQELSVALYRHLLGLQEGEGSLDQPAAGKDLNLLCCDIDPLLIERAQQFSPFPASISFANLDIMDSAAREPFLSSYLGRFGRSAFDIGFCMSVTMWIHLNHGDSGLRELLSLLSSLCTYLLIEPQPWKCYRAAARRLRKLGRSDFDHFRSLAINGDMAERITQILTRDCAMELVCCFGSTSWDRSLLLFKSNGSDREGRESSEQEQ